MFKHNLKIGYRSLVREKAYATVNIVGMAVCLVIFQYVHFQMSYNTFHSNHQNTYRAVLKEVNSPTREKDPYTPPSEAPHARGFYVTRGFEKTYGLELLAGSPFTKNMDDENSVIMNESALATYGFGSADEAINQKIFDDGDERERTIVGVVKDFHWHSLHEDHKPYVLSLYEGRMTENISIRIHTSNPIETLVQIQDAFEAFFPGNPFEYTFANDTFYRQYSAEQQFAVLLFFFSALAILIGCVGFFALVSYAINSKVKEIGIRKVLGASANSIMILLTNDYFKLVCVAIGLGTPIIWFGGKSWLENYATRIYLGLDVFLVPAILLLLIAVLTVGHRTIRSASANPVDALRDE